MGIARGKKIVTDGLVLALDAANTKSYSGTGTTWSDLSGNGNDGTLTNGPTFDSGNGGSIVFDGVDDYCTLPDIDTHSSTAKFTIEGVVKAISGNYGRIFTNGSSGVPGGITGYINIDLIVSTSSSKPYLQLRVGNTVALQSTQISTSFWSLDNFVMYFAFSADKQNRTGSYLFRFGQNEGLIQNELSSTYTPGTATGFVENRLGAETDNESYAQMDMYAFKMYDRELSMSEMRQNYNATKDRFGL